MAVAVDGSWLTRRMDRAEWLLSNVLFMCVSLLCFTAAQVYTSDYDDFFIGDKVVFAVNCGGTAHKDVNGVRYQKDVLTTGVSSDHGRRYIISRVPQPDQALYQTERYHFSDFSYTVPIAEDGNYVIVLKFSEVYFTQPDQKVFDVLVNEQMVVSYLDIFATVGHAVAHDEHIPLVITDNRLTFIRTGKTVQFDAKLKITFAKGTKDNPKVNALYVLRGTSDDVPVLAAVPAAPEEPEPEQAEPRQPADEHEFVDDDDKRSQLGSGPKIDDPYDTMEQSQMFLPILVALACFFPLLYCLCRI